jgi:hypothetical protein
MFSLMPRMTDDETARYAAARAEMRRTQRFKKLRIKRERQEKQARQFRLMWGAPS